MRNRAQSMVEYGLLICICAAALLAMQVYLKRGLQGRMRGYADEISGGSGYSPGATSSASTINKTIMENSGSLSVRIGTKVAGSITNSTTTVFQGTQRSEEVLPFSQEPQR